MTALVRIPTVLRPAMGGDTSVVGWQVMALKSAQLAYLNVPQSAFDGVPIMGESLSDARRHQFLPRRPRNHRAFPLRLGRRQFRDRKPRNLPNGTALPFS